MEAGASDRAGLRRAGERTVSHAAAAPSPGPSPTGGEG